MDEDIPPPSSKPSQVPSWVMLGFALGALFVLALPRRSALEPAPIPAIEAPSSKPAKPAEPPRITTIEAVFFEWGKYAVWSDDTTEVALWDSETKSFSDCYEVLRVGDDYYFRSITSLTRPLLVHGVADGSPLQFTETDRQKEEWLSEVGRENMKALSESMHQPTITPPTETPRR